MFAIEIKNFTKIYSSGLKKKVVAIDDLSLNIEEGEIFGFLGPNGAGKSTTIKAILGIIRPTSGEIFISGKKSCDSSSRLKVGFLPENPIFYEYLTAEELLLYVGQTFGMDKKDIIEKGNSLISQMGLEDAKKTRLRYFSKGMIQKIGLIQAVIHNPDILILDEPASGLDPIGRRQMRDLLLSFKGRGKTIFFSSHILHDVETISDRIGILVNGKLRFCGAISEVLYISYERYEIKTGKINFETTEKLTNQGIKINSSQDSWVTTVPKDKLWEIVKTLGEEGISILSIEPTRRNLEDSFMELIKRQESYGEGIK